MRCGMQLLQRTVRGQVRDGFCPRVPVQSLVFLFAFGGVPGLVSCVHSKRNAAGCSLRDRMFEQLHMR